MKFVDLINEDFTPDAEQLKEMKSARAVYAVHKKGAVVFTHYSNRNKNDKDNIVKYKLGEPEYKWYPKNGNVNDMYLTVVVKNLTVYIKDPVLYDAIVVNPNRMQDYYGPLIYNYIIPKARKRFEQHKVKLHVGEPVVEFVLVEPEEPQTINEETISDKDSKRIKAVYQALKKGMVKRIEEHGEALFSYKLSDEFKAHIEDGALHVTPDGMKIKEMNKAASNSNFGSVYTALKKRFKNYKINFNVPPMQWSDLIDYVPEDVSSKEPINEELSDKDVNKCKTLWKVYNKGIIKLNDKKYKYQLKDDFVITEGYVISDKMFKPYINIKGNYYDIIRIWEMQDNGHGIYMDYDLHNSIHFAIKNRLKKKFEDYGVVINL